MSVSVKQRAQLTYGSQRVFPRSFRARDRQPEGGGKVSVDTDGVKGTAPGAQRTCTENPDMVLSVCLVEVRASRRKTFKWYSRRHRHHSTPNLNQHCIALRSRQLVALPGEKWKYDYDYDYDVCGWPRRPPNVPHALFGYQRRHPRARFRW